MGLNNRDWARQQAENEKQNRSNRDNNPIIAGKNGESHIYNLPNTGREAAVSINVPITTDKRYVGEWRNGEKQEQNR